MKFAILAALANSIFASDQALDYTQGGENWSKPCLTGNE